MTSIKSCRRTLNATRMRDECDPASAKHVHEHAGKKYLFLLHRLCCGKFKADPGKYLNSPARIGHARHAAHGGSIRDGPATPGSSSRNSRPPPKSASRGPPAYVCPMCPEVRESKPGACPSCGMALEPDVPLAATRTEYTCPMHPEIVRSEPGSCPICGMALEPRTVTASQEENPELRDMTRRFWVGVVLTAPLARHRHGQHVLASSVSIDLQLQRPAALILPWIEFLLATPVVLWCGLPFFQRFWTSLVNRSPNMFTLIGLGTGVAYVYSVVATVAPQNFPRLAARHGRISRRLLRSRRRHHGARSARTGHGTPRPQPHQRRHSRAARPQPENGAPAHRPTATVRKKTFPSNT